jgi:hypothetical protein
MRDFCNNSVTSSILSKAMLHTVKTRTKASASYDIITDNPTIIFNDCRRQNKNKMKGSSTIQ